MSIKLIAAVIIAYLLGNFSPALTISRLKGEDIRTKGSGNAGTTNVLRIYGKKAAAVTLLLDIFKGVLAVLIGRMLLSEGLVGACALAVICGHIWPCFHQFRGGKGVATALGAILTVSPLTGVIVLAVALVLIAATRMVSLGSICAAALLPVVSFFTCRSFFPFALAMAVIVIFKHRANIGRLMSGTESKISFKK